MSTKSKTVHFLADPGNGTQVSRALAKVFGVSTDAPVLLAEMEVSSSGFDLDIPETDSGYYYMVLRIDSYSLNGGSADTGNRNVTLLAVFDASAGTVSVGAQSTIACAYAFARFLRVGDDGYPAIQGETRRIGIAFAMKNNFTGTDGTISKVISSSPNGLETNSFPLFNFLSNLLYYSLTEASVYQQFVSLASPDSPARSFLGALMHLVYNPFTNVQQIYALISGQTQVFEPSLPTLDLPPHKTPVPDQWTLTIKRNDSGSRNFLISGTAFVVFDKEDKAWITNNFRAGTAFSGTHAMILNPDGSPNELSPLFGGGILGSGFGAAIDPKRETIAIGNYGWGPVDFNPETGSISVFSYDGKVQCPPNGHTNGLCRVQGMTYDKDGNLWMASIGSQKPMAPAPDPVYTFPNQNSALVVYLGGDPNRMISFDNFLDQPSPYHATFDVVIDSEGNGIVSNIGNADYGLQSSVYKFRIENDQLVYVAHWVSDYVNPRNPASVGYEQFRQVTVNAQNEIFVGGVTSSRVVKLDSSLQNVLKVFTKNVNAAWGVRMDKAGVLYVANFAQEKGRNSAIDSFDMHGPFGVTVIYNEDESTSHLMTVPTGGSGVTLANGQPLYGSQEGPLGRTFKPCYEPIMRLTSTNVDAAGNVWAMNNWKPSVYVDIKDNPGGDGVVIFVGVAEPAV
ncbi:hypothetical protein GCM10010967_30550 [Dyadobacter beijingensis]|uniref:Uncharacterized protein n=1 Tax=Dyadobacter beijingensis TaxID=365489 RepID=A0ABQ2HY66_9BACT|nr:hypothetical protein [Dyadobacter beijingensis]GGM95059.1 hypothetical protein GCM10010967_30550 [Dyadobacter beijingensis]